MNLQILHYIITLSLNKLRFIMAYLMNQIEVLRLLNKTKSVACNDVGYTISKLKMSKGWLHSQECHERVRFWK